MKRPSEMIVTAEGHLASSLLIHRQLQTGIPWHLARHMSQIMLDDCILSPTFIRDEMQRSIVTAP